MKRRMPHVAGKPIFVPDPASAGPRPAARSRESARSAEPRERNGGDFDSVLKERPGREEREPKVTKEPAAAKSEPAPAPDAVPPAGAAAMALAAPAAAPQPVAVEAPIPAEADRTEIALAAGARVAVTDAPAVEPASLGAPKPPTTQITAAGRAPSPEPATAQPQPEMETEAPATPAAPVRGEALLAEAELAQLAPAHGSAATRSGPAKPNDIPLAQVDAPRKPAAERSEEDEPSGPDAARRDGASVDPTARETARAVAPAVAGAGTQGPAIRDAAPPAWHLAADSSLAPSRAEAAPAPALGQTQAVLQAVQPQAIVGQVSVAIGRASSDDIEIRLDPPELGRVQIHLTRHDGGIQAMVLSDRPETHDLLRRHAEALARELGSAGFDNVSLDFAAGGEARPGRDEARGLDWMQAAPGLTAATSPEAPAPRTAVRDIAGGLDIRL